MKKVLWFSRHELTETQIADLEKVLGDEIGIVSVNRTIKNVFELKDEIDF